MLLHPGTFHFANCSSSNACIMVLPKLAFVLLCSHFFLHYHVHDNLQCTLYGFIVRLGKCRVSKARALLVLSLCFECYPQSVWSSWKQNVLMHHDQATLPIFWLITGCTLKIKHFIFSVLYELIVQMPFMLLFVYNTYSFHDTYTRMNCWNHSHI